MAKCIEFNSFNTYFKYILLTILFRYFNTCLLGYNHNDSFEPVNLNKFIYDRTGNEIKIDLTHFKIIEFFLISLEFLFFLLLVDF